MSVFLKSKLWLVVLGILLFNSPAWGQVTCIQVYLASQDHDALGFAPSDVQALVSKVAHAIGLTPTGIMTVPCADSHKVEASYFDRSDIPKGDYILYDPIWVRQVLGASFGNSVARRQYDEGVVLFGHELGHLLDRDFTANSNLPRLQKETNADRFAGCAASALSVSWSSVEGLLGRMRGESDTDYPSREHSLAAAKVGFDTCRRGGPMASGGTPRLKILGTEKSFCSDLLAIATDASNSFSAISVPTDSESDSVVTTAFVKGFNGCNIRKGDYLTYSCVTDIMGPADSGAYFRRIGKKIGACLNQAWTRSDLSKDIVAFNNRGEKKSIIFSISRTLALDASDAYQGNLMIYDDSRKLGSADEKPSHLQPSPNKPAGYCEVISEFILDGKAGFPNSIIKNAKDPSSFVLKKNLPGWSECRAHSLNDDGSGKYITCSLGPFVSQSEAEKMISAIQPDLSACLGSEWSTNKRTRSNGTLAVDVSKTVDMPSLELRERKDYQNMWQVSIDVDSPAGQ